MREIRQSGLAGGGAELNRLSLPRSESNRRMRVEDFHHEATKVTKDEKGGRRELNW